MQFTRRKVIAGAGIAGLAVAGGAIAYLIGPGSEVVPGRSRARPVRSTGRIPKTADVVIIGAGNIGAAAALYLAEAGLSVVVCEKGAVAGEASGRSVGHVFGLGMEEDQLSVVAEAKKHWPGLNAMTGHDTGYRPFGCAIAIGSEEERAFWEQWIDASHDLAPSARILDRKEAADLVDVNKPWLGAIFDPTDASAEPQLVAPALMQGAIARGAKLAMPCAVRGIETEGGAISGVVTEQGPIRAKNVILAGGAWSTTFLQNLGLRLPVGNLFSWCASFGAAAGPTINGIFENTTWRRQIDGNFVTSLMEASAPITPQSFRYLREMLSAMQVASNTWTVHPRLGGYFFEELMEPATWKLDEVSPFERRRILEPAMNDRIVDKALTKMRTDVGGFANLSVKSVWGGVLSSTSDTKPVLGPVATIPGLVLAAGFSEGLTMAPAAGKAAADLITGRTPTFNLATFRYDRFL